MKNEQEHTPTDELLARYLAGETDLSETKEVESWIAASAANRAEFEQLKKTWQASATQQQVLIDTDAAWSRMKIRMRTAEEIPAAPKRNYLRMAAAVGVFILLSVAVFWYSRPNEIAVQPLALSSGNEFVQDTIPDGSIIGLNKNSRLTYPSSFTGAVREVTLSGEAFFEVHKDAAHPFIIHSGPMDIKVLGTSFNVRAYPKSDSVRVSVRTGKVQCVAGGDTVYLLPGEAAVYDEPHQKLRKIKDDDPNVLAYRNRIFQFHNTRLADAIRQVNEVYGSKIILKNELLSDCDLTTVFRNEPIDNIVEVIGLQLNLSFTKQGNTFYLDGKGCK